jgi:uncharacterized spore protein YtfJ
MSKDFEVIAESIPSQKEANDLLEKLIAVGNTDAVFSDPVVSGEYTVITAAEARVAMGFGFGGGGGSDSGGESEESEGSVGYGGGGGGGGASVARPVAIIEIGPNGVRVEPIIDPTKIALAFVTMLITIFSMGARMRRIAKG